MPLRSRLAFFPSVANKEEGLQLMMRKPPAISAS